MGSGGLFVMTFSIRLMRMLLASSWALLGPPAIEQVPVEGQYTH